ncbi:alpha/beta fold hydrolase [Novosphingobium colocasiae]|uniref:alpha/beta fold hydrolase n=1 Tax=Novosphingobium colocasiae TaxID=1256513 RepID=UPI0035B4042C
MTKPPKMPNPQASIDYLTDACAKLSGAMQHFLQNPPSLSMATSYDTSAVMAAMTDVMTGVMTQPQRLIETQMKAFDEWSRMWQDMWTPGLAAKPAVAPERGDRRFSDGDWESSPFFRSLKDSHLLAARHLREFVQSSTEEDKSKRAMAELIVEQYLNAVSPTNFILTNPQVMRRTIDTCGANLIAGFANMLEDLATGRGIVQRRTDNGAFRLGENLACTPGGVVFQNHLMQINQYTATTASVRARPLLYVPPLVNKYYMIDLQPASSLVKWLVDQGHTVFVVSWVDPDESHRDCGVEDYVGTGVIEAIEQVRKVTGSDAVDLFGFCMGGTLLSMATAVLAARGELDKVGSATLIGALVDFTDMMEWSAFVNDAHVDALDVHIGDKGYIAKDELQRLFSMMRANDLIWSSYISHYLLDKEAPPSDLLFWFEDGSHIPEAFLRTYNRKLLLEDKLREPGAVTLLGEHLDLTQITVPVTIIGLKDDHVSSWKSVFRGRQYFGGEPVYILGGSGHNAGVINHPSRKKHGFWTNADKTTDADAWFAGAQKHEGSWWPHWSDWLYANDPGEEVPARKLGGGKLKVLEKAPGSYVLGA